MEALLVLVAALALAAVALAILILKKLSSPTASRAETEALALLPTLAADAARAREDLARLEQSVRAEGAGQRQELSGLLAAQRAELTDRVGRLETSLNAAFGTLSSSLAAQVERLTAGVHAGGVSQSQSLAGMQKAHAEASEALRAQVIGRLDAVTKAQADAAAALRAELLQRLDASASAQHAAATTTQSTLSAELGKTRGEITTAVGTLTKETGANLSAIAENVTAQLSRQAKDTGDHVEKLRSTVELKLTGIQAAADAKLEQMRATVDEKLTSTLGARLGESFKQVSERLDAVHAGLGEMKSLAGNVTDLRRVMTNVKTRGVWGEVQLANLLDQLFTRDQYEANYKPRPRSGETVEFALKLPGPEGGDKPVFLPIDSKFPIEDYQRLVDASEIADPVAVKAAQKALENRLYDFAKEIRDKYIAPPSTTNFAVLFLPTEALYAEALRTPGLLEALTRDYKIIVQGPTTFSAFAMALLMGFRTLSIQKRSAEIGNLLGAVKADFGKFADLLGKVEEKLDDAKGNIQKARQRSTQIVRKLGKVEELPQAEARLILPDPTSDPDATLTPDQD